MQYNHNKELKKNQMEVLRDISENGKERPWKDKKKRSIQLAESYQRIGNVKKYYRVRECGSYLEFKRYIETNVLKLNRASFCQVRLCPLCAWRRELKIFAQVSKIMDKALDNKDYRFLFLTLTCENVYGEDLLNTLDKLFDAFNKFCQRRKIKKILKGWFRALEVTHNVNELITREMWYGDKEKHIKPRAEYYERHGLKIGDKNLNYNTYHPHFHVILMVNNKYFKDKDLYITQEEWTSYWKESLQVDYPPKVDIRAFKTNSKSQTKKSIAETAKYTVKDNDYLVTGDEELTDSAVMILDRALAKRRLVAFGGELKKIHKELNLPDPETADINIDDDEEVREEVEYIIESYKWHIGYSQYYKI